MYNTFYNLKENPFNMTADPAFFYLSSRHAEAFSHLVYGIEQRKGILVITGEVGTGKTTLCKTLLTKLDTKTKTALILNPNFSDLQLLKLIVNDLGINGNFKNKFDIINTLNDFLIEETKKSYNIVIIVDEAQHLKPRQLEQIRLLSNLETDKDKLLQIVLVGQPELLDKLKLSSLRQLNQRISVRYHLLPLMQHELRNYIEHRLKIASATENNPNKPYFTDEAINLIYEMSEGTPRMVNIICDRALLAAYTLETHTINEHIINKSAKEVVYQ